ncbi:uncharacterized protein LOC129942780 isoform X2 [Eupeodes corollae]|nr:uncharacterized protein LOC129942780 isoform X2 [Eupeodes corollae]XP_055907826.1 uncharacterized protein LOC129942780 isoform X2 [Eupeodes corollae]
MRNTMSQETNVSSLLSSWGLSDLQSKFKLHRIESRALLCLTEKDICELIPRIGRRAIFRSSLKEWRRRNFHHKRRSAPPAMSSSLRIDPRIELESASNSEETPPPTNNIPHLNTVVKDEQMHSDYESEEVSEHMQIQNGNIILPPHVNGGGGGFDEDQSEEEEEQTSLERPFSETPEAKKFNVTMSTKKNSNNCNVDVSEILSNSPEGQQIIAYYEVNGSFDYSHRRRLVTLLINEVVRQNKWLVQEDFAKISHDIIQMFPREDVNTYYTARNGLKNPKGCLYNKFLNLTRKLRQEGILQYRNNVQIMPERISTRHSGEIKCYTESY